jgi:hypothetical protein
MREVCKGMGGAEVIGINNFHLQVKISHIFAPRFVAREDRHPGFED